MIALGSISEGETTSQPLQGLLELRTGNKTTGFSGEPLRREIPAQWRDVLLPCLPVGFKGCGVRIFSVPAPFLVLCTPPPLSPFTYCDEKGVGEDQRVPATCPRSHSEHI